MYAKTRDEIGELATIFNHMIINLKDSSENLIREKNQSDAILSHIPVGVIVTSFDNRLIIANKLAEQVLNFKSSDVRDKFLLDFISNADFLSVLKDEFEHKRSFHTREVHTENLDAASRIYHLTSSHVSSIGMISLIRDITHEKELDSLRDSFLRTVSHELRTPLTSIMGFVELVKSNMSSKQHKEYLLKHQQLLLNFLFSLLVLVHLILP